MCGEPGDSVISRRCAARVVGEEEALRDLLRMVEEEVSQLPEESRKRVDEAFENAVEALAGTGNLLAEEMGFILSDDANMDIATLAAEAYIVLHGMVATLVRRGYTEKEAFSKAAPRIFNPSFIALVLAVRKYLSEKERGR